MPSRHRGPRRTSLAALAAVLALPVLALTATGSPVRAASSKGCVGANPTVLGKSGPFDGTVTPDSNDLFTMQGRYQQFQVDPTTFAVYNQAFTANSSQSSGGVTPLYASKVPNLRGATLTGPIRVQLSGDSFSISRSGGGVTMTLTGKDCGAGGIFQMEPERADGTRTRIVHTLAGGAFYFDNPNFRAHLGEFLGADCTSVTAGPPSKFCVKVTPRVNIARDDSPRLVLRDSAQVATRVKQTACGPDFKQVTGDTADHCGAMSIWDVASGGRMGMVTGEDSVEVANPPTTCTHQCQAQNQTKGRLVVLGAPSPVPAASRLGPATSTDGLDTVLTAP